MKKHEGGDDQADEHYLRHCNWRTHKGDANLEVAQGVLFTTDSKKWVTGEGRRHLAWSEILMGRGDLPIRRSISVQ